jgi:hypothetical protein
MRPDIRDAIITTMDAATNAAVAWLLRSDEPGIRHQTRRDLLGQDRPAERKRIATGPMVRALFEGQQPDGGFGGHPYKKWYGAHWRLVALAELGLVPGDERAAAMADRVLTWLVWPNRLEKMPVVQGLYRVHASLEGNAIGACCRLGFADDPRVARLARALADWQWPDGGWNCHLRASGRRSSFHESFIPAWGLGEYAAATGARWAASAARRAAELFLSHRLFRATTDGRVISRGWTVLHYPPYWHYDILAALVVLTRLGLVRDPRATEALDLLEHRRRDDGCWQPGAYWWKGPDGTGSGPSDVVDWGRGGPSEMLTLNALRVLRAAGRLS